MLKVLIAGGGTGGHIYPALTLADAIKKAEPDAEICFVGTENGMEKDLVPRAGYPIRFIDVQGFRRKLSFDTVKSVYKLIKGIFGAKNIIEDFRPDLVIGTGGYVCGPVVFLAALAGIPTCIQEQNAMPGVTNRILSRFVDKIFLGYSEADKYFKGDAERFYSGNPIRKEILASSREEGIEVFGLSADMKTVLITGGSQGAVSLNKAVLSMEARMSGREDVQILHSTGKKNYDEYMSKVEEKGGFEENIHIVPYLYDMPLALAAADIGVFRSGAIGLAELTAKGVPAILVPYPYATANHQEFNARALEAVGAAEVVLDKDVTGEKLQEIIERLLLHENELNDMKKAARKSGRPNATEEIVKEALKLVKK